MLLFVVVCTRCLLLCTIDFTRTRACCLHSVLSCGVDNVLSCGVDNVTVPYKMNLQGQDWGEVVIRKKKPTAAQAQTEASVNAVWLVESAAVVNRYRTQSFPSGAGTSIRRRYRHSQEV